MIMRSVINAIETTGIVEQQNRLVLDETLPIADESRVRVIILFPENDIDEKDWLHAASINPAFDFLKDKEEDIYTQADGKPFHDKG